MISPFVEQFEGMFVIACVLEKRVQAERGINPRRDALVRPNGLLSDLGVGPIIRAGKINIATNIVLGSVRQNDGPSGDYQITNRSSF